MVIRLKELLCWQSKYILMTYVILYPPPFHVTGWGDPHSSQGTVGGPLPIPVTGDGLKLPSFALEEIWFVGDDNSFGKVSCFCCWSWVGGGLVRYLARNIDLTFNNMGFELFT